MKPILLSLILTVAVTTACSGSESSTPNAGQAQTENPVLGLWQLNHEVDEDLVVDENDPVDIYAEYLEITEDSYILYVTDGVSNCYDADSFPLEHVSGEAYTLDVEPFGVAEIYLEASESTLTIGGPDAEDVELGRVVNINSQDFNSCTF